MRLVGKLLVVEVVNEAGGSPALLVLPELPCVRAHRRLDCEHVLPQRFARGVLVHQRQRLGARRNGLGHRFFPGGFGVGVDPILPKSMKPRFGFVESSSTSISSPTSTPFSPRIRRPSTGGFSTRTYVPLDLLPVTIALKRSPMRLLKRIAAAILRTL